MDAMMTRIRVLVCLLLAVPAVAQAPKSVPLQVQEQEGRRPVFVCPSGYTLWIKHRHPHTKDDSHSWAKATPQFLTPEELRVTRFVSCWISSDAGGPTL